MMYVVIGLIVIIIILLVLLLRKENDRIEVADKSNMNEAVDHPTDSGGIGDFTEKQQSEKSAHKEEILSLFANDPELSNEQIRDSLKISDRTVVRYMDELEQEGRVRQVGKTGRSVTYRRTP